MPNVDIFQKTALFYAVYDEKLTDEVIRNKQCVAGRE